MFTIENNELKISVAAKGAELQSLFQKGLGLEYMWEGDPAFWPKHSPVLFPVVGALKDGSYTLGENTYKLPRHGFAREQEFTADRQAPGQLLFSLSSSEETLKAYPFPFRLELEYMLEGNALKVTYRVHNPGEGVLYFSIGGHPAFRLPIIPGTTYDDYRLRFSQKETAGRWPITKDGLIGEMPEPFLRDSDTLPLSRELFSKDAVVLKGLRSDTVFLESDKTERGLEFSFPGYPFLGLWAAPGADFLCIEPWCRIADSVNASGRLEEKEGIRMLGKGETFTASWTVRPF